MRRRCLLVDTIRLASFPGMEAVLLRCPKFFAKEHVMTVFPAAERCLRRIQGTPAGGEALEAACYLLYTFQPSDFAPGESVTSVDGGEGQGLAGEDDGGDTSGPSATPSTVVSSSSIAEDGFSELIQYSPTAGEWKDRSRERFFTFMVAVQARLAKHLGNANTSSSRFFMDWPDPATGLPICTDRGGTTFCDADAIQQFFSFHSVLIAGPGGGCRMVEHPRLGLDVYPAAGVLVLPRDAEEVLCTTIRSFAA
ncbi:hypothetical protein LSCM1_03841 [Leishmania martiniquensis]|uniref:Uncharacterized protein n=1 Tax=Leishmania martiniquensis TaxID=1580590 RepID=A0A836GR45_9TRYP|nr:hypothetical protein LSCM1_03841 [Leishmania martiniquensis]